MTATKCSLSPQNISETVWYFENPRHLDLVIEHRASNGVFLWTETVRVPKRMLKESLGRMG